jgi:hypothetical protein
MLAGLQERVDFIRRLTLFYLIGIALLGGFANLAIALTFDSIQNLSVTPGSFPNFPEIAVSGSNIFVVWEEGNRDCVNCGCASGCDIFFRRSTDEGITWAPPLDLPAINLSNDSTNSQLPRIAVSGSIVFVAWLDPIDGQGGLLYRRSTDGGSNFEPTQTLRIGASEVRLAVAT